MENRHEKPVPDHGWPSNGDRGFHVVFESDGAGNVEVEDFSYVTTINDYGAFVNDTVSNF